MRQSVKKTRSSVTPDITQTPKSPLKAACICVFFLSIEDSTLPVSDASVFGSATPFSTTGF
jgi:hypothetical protein